MPEKYLEIGHTAFSVTPDSSL